MSDIFRIYLPAEHPLCSDRRALRGYWELQVIEQGGRPVPGGVTVRQIGERVMVAGRAEKR